VVEENASVYILPNCDMLDAGELLADLGYCMLQPVRESLRFRFKPVPAVRVPVRAVIIHILPVVVDNKIADVDLFFL
jgi:hypothetical protein